MSWVYVPGAEPLNSDCELPSQLLAASVTSRGKRMQPRYWSRAWRKGGWIRLLSGVTLEPSTARLGVASFIASLRETPASPTPSPDCGAERTTTDGSSTRSSGSSRKCGRLVSSGRTYRGTPTDSFTFWSRHWKDWATALRQDYSQRPRPELPTDGSGFSSWPTPNAMEPEPEGGKGYAGQGSVEAELYDPRPTSTEDEVDDASGSRQDGAGQGKPAEPERGERLPSDGRDELADAPHRTGGLRLPGRRPRQPDADAGGPSEGMADAYLGDGEQHEGRGPRPGGAEGGRSRSQPPGSGSCLPLFAPGPGDPRWPAIIGERPDLTPATQPGLRGVADGLAERVGRNRVDRLRTLGNGVVPLQAAYAYRSLRALLSSSG